VEGPSIDQHLAMQAGADVTYYVADHLGSVAQATNAAGVVTLTRQYDPWGNLLAGGTTSGWAFTGREWDPETGLYYYRARYYDPTLGRFIDEDPIGLAAGPNFYRYVENRVATLTDPWGLKATLYCERIPATYDLFRHCYIEISCKDWCFVLEMWGPPKENDPRSGQGYGRPRVGPCDSRRNARSTSSPITPPASCTSDCSFENRVFEEYVRAAQNVPPYNPRGPNSNTFASGVIRNAGGNTRFPWNAPQ
jgi:RHS repeat-associated protein